MSSITRRGFVLASAGLLAAYAMPGAASLRPTPRQSAGPFYPRQLPLDDDNNLVRVNGQEAPAKGQVTELYGRVLDRNGDPLQAVRVEIWQCDAHGRYHHPGDRRDQPIDPGFQGFGHTLTDSNGGYRFRTIHPVPYPGRTPHIHVAVLPDGVEPFISQFYVAGEPRNASDFLYQAIPEDQRSLVTIDFAPDPSDAKIWLAEKDIILASSA